MKTNRNELTGRGFNQALNVGWNQGQTTNRQEQH